MQIMSEPARDTDGAILGMSFSTAAARLDVRPDGTFFMEAAPLLERDDLIALRALIDKALQSHTSTGGASLRQG